MVNLAISCDQKLQVSICCENATNRSQYCAERFILRVNFQGNIILEDTYYLDIIRLEPE